MYELTRKNLVSQKQIQLRALVSKRSNSPTISKSSDSEDFESKDINSTSNTNTIEIPQTDITMSLGAFLNTSSVRKQEKQIHQAIPTAPQHTILSLSINQQLSKENSNNQRNVSSPALMLVPKPLRCYLIDPSNHQALAHRQASKTNNSSFLKTKHPSSTKDIFLEKKLIHWEFNYDPSQQFFDSHIFLFADSSWKLILEKNLTNRAIISYNLMLYRFLPTNSSSHHTLTLTCLFELHHEMKSSYQYPSPPSKSRTHTDECDSTNQKLFIYHSRFPTLSSSSLTSSKVLNCNGYVNFITLSDIQKYVNKNGKIELTAELILLESRYQ